MTVYYFISKQSVQMLYVKIHIQRECVSKVARCITKVTYTCTLLHSTYSFAEANSVSK